MKLETEIRRLKAHLARSKREHAEAVARLHSTISSRNHISEELADATRLNSDYLQIIRNLSLGKQPPEKI